MLSLLKTIREALDEDPDSETSAFCTIFSNAFDNVANYKKLVEIEIGGCLLQSLFNYLKGRKLYVRLDNTRSRTLTVTYGVPQGFLLSPLHQ